MNGSDKVNTTGLNKMYVQFKDWLIQNGKIKDNPHAVEHLWSINCLLAKKGYFTPDLFSLIRTRSFDSIYKLRREYWYKKWWKDGQDRQSLSLFFEYLSQSYDEYEEYEAGRTFEEYAKQNVLLVYSGRIACIRYKHIITDVAAHIELQGEERIVIHASYCMKCRIAFIRKEYYKQLCHRYRLLPVFANFVELGEDGYTAAKPPSMAPESVLMLCGYSVKEKGLTTPERQAILEKILSSGILSKTEIIEYLEYFISFHGRQDRMCLAVAKWEEDLDFVRRYDLKSHLSISVRKIERYRRPIHIVQNDCDNKAVNAESNVSDHSIIFGLSNARTGTLAKREAYSYVGKRVFCKGTDGQGRPLKYGNITGETSTTVDVAFDSGYSSQFPKDMFDSGMLVIVGNY